MVKCDMTYFKKLKNKLKIFPDSFEVQYFLCLKNGHHSLQLFGRLLQHHCGPSIGMRVSK